MKTRKVAGGIRVKVLDGGSKNVKNSINRDSLLNKRKKRLNKRVWLERDRMVCILLVACI